MSDGRDTRAESARARWQRRSREARTPRARLERLVRLSSLSLLVEGLWPRLWLPIGIAMAFASVSWLGLWGALPPLARMAGAGLFLLAFLVSLWPTIRLLASRARAVDARAEALARLDRESGLPHRPATSFEDGLAIGADDEGSRALWALHRARAEAEIARLRAPAPRPEMARRDRYALRAAGVLVFAASAFVAGPDLGARLGSAFDWRAPTLAEADFRIDGWIDPPHYTRRPPIMLDLSGGETRLSAPVDSRIVVRIAGRGDATIEPFGGLVADEGEDAPARAAPRPTPVAVGGSAAAASELREERFVLRSDGELSVRTGLLGGATLVVEAIPDDPPTIAFAGPPESERGGALIVGYSGSDDYGIASAEALVEPPVGLESRRTLVPPPSLPLAPPAPGREEELQSRFDLSDNPWGGAPVRLTLSARDAAGQEGRSETLTLTLPMRPFADPLARALVEQRRNLVLAPDHASRVQTALDALLIAPDIYTPRWGVFLGLNSAATRLRSARSDEDLVAVADFLWEMAVMIEDGDLSQAQRDLMSAAERLQEAMERNADQDEIDRLMQELRAAMDNMLRELAEQMMRNQDAEDLAESLPPDAQVMTRQDLEDFLSELENALRNGDMAEAERLMNQLRDMMQNLQTARPDSRMSDPLSREMERQMNELDDLLRGQGDLRDETFRDGQDPGQQQQQRRQQQGESGEGDEQSLAERQQALRDRLEALQQRMRELGMQGEEGLDDAEQAMRDAEGALQQGDSGQAVDDQGRAMEGLQRGMQGMAQQMQEMMGDGQGEGEGMGQGMQPGMPGEPGQRGRADARRDDPLGRPSRGRDFSDGDVRIPDADASAAQRARRILEELREKLGDPTRPREELDYFERLLRPN